jgi:hypothetical protein
MYAYCIVCIPYILEKNASKPKTAEASPRCTPAQLLRFFVLLLPRRALPGEWHEFSLRATLRTTVHIPDGFLSTPVWAALDVIGGVAVVFVLVT